MGGLLKFTSCLQVNGFAMEHLDAALQGTEVVVIPAGVPRKVCIASLFSCLTF